ncbi:MAG: SagB/ThcOx family dehydrogenase [Chitinivibrionales bacterium]|nr:SagB/ThcOx family dehydrogenase [Chitinivibrionales bacterium]MBD3356259.1 SagB/ThcOx family dehydrogenase [Chitinivibrionales bacterium]
MIQLPLPGQEGAMSVEQAIAHRRSVRAYKDSTLSERQIAQLLFAAQGITDTSRGFRAAPSAGATYPLESYVVTKDGVFHYLPEDHALKTIKKGNYMRELGKAAMGQSYVSSAPVVVVLTAVPERTTDRYGERGRLYVYVEAGHAAQNIHLQAVALGLGSVPVGAFEPDEVCEIVECGPKETAIYLIPIGIPRDSKR